MRRWKLVRRGAKVPDDGTRWWQELAKDQTADGVRSVGYEAVEVVPLSEVTEALLGEEAVRVLFRHFGSGSEYSVAQAAKLRQALADLADVVSRGAER